MILLRPPAILCRQKLWQAAAHQVLLARRSLTRGSGARSSRAAGRPAAGRIRARPRCAAARKAAINFTAMVSTNPSCAGTPEQRTTQVLVRFYEPSSGTISLGEVDLAHIDDADLRSDVAWVPQVRSAPFADLR